MLLLCIILAVVTFVALGIAIFCAFHFFKEYKKVQMLKHQVRKTETYLGAQVDDLANTNISIGQELEAAYVSLEMALGMPHDPKYKKAKAIIAEQEAEIRGEETDGLSGVAKVMSEGTDGLSGVAKVMSEGTGSDV